MAKPSPMRGDYHAARLSAALIRKASSQTHLGEARHRHRNGSLRFSCFGEAARRMDGSFNGGVCGWAGKHWRPIRVRFGSVRLVRRFQATRQGASIRPRPTQSFISKRARSSSRSSPSKEAVVAILSAGDFFGEGCLAGQSVRMATATTMSECSIMRLEKAGVVRVLHEQPAFSDLLLHHLLSRNIRIEEDLVDQLFNSSEKRLARVLLLLANFGKD